MTTCDRCKQQVASQDADRWVLLGYDNMQACATCWPIFRAGMTAISEEMAQLKESREKKWAKEWLNGQTITQDDAANRRG
jgi:hypothetical protein